MRRFFMLCLVSLAAFLRNFQSCSNVSLIGSFYRYKKQMHWEEGVSL